eukprot:6160269-Prorocentrum_lima.AAC.1
MTSSLVGSEMCIRDRLGRLLVERIGRRDLGRALLRLDRQRHRRLCLLYTSDAADECRSRWS